MCEQRDRALRAVALPAQPRCIPASLLAMLAAIALTGAACGPPPAGAQAASDAKSSADAAGEQPSPQTISFTPIQLPDDAELGCAEFAIAACSYVHRCIENLAVSAESGCLESARATCLRGVAARSPSLADGAVRFDSDAWLACLSGIEGVFCVGAGNPYAPLSEATFRCRAVFQGESAVGEVCVDRGQCAPTLQCVAEAPSTCEGRCAAAPVPSGEGESCQAHADCQTALVCTEQRCVPRAGVGSACATSRDCAYEAYCAVTGGLRATRTCRTRIALDAACPAPAAPEVEPSGAGGGCILGAYCSQANGTCRLYPTAPGDPCEPPMADCPSIPALLCSPDSECTAAPSPGQLCGADDARCRFGRCPAAGEACEPWLALGATCASGEECASAACVEGRCTVLEPGCAQTDDQPADWVITVAFSALR